MSLKSEYKASLKSVEAEEILDLIIFRPISFLIVKLIYNTNITPNQVSIAAMLFGIVSGIFYSFSTYGFFIIAASCFFMCNTLDCVDGQLARLKKNGTKIGRIVDGFIDYISSFSIFFGIALALSILTGDIIYSWLLTLAAGVSKAFQNMFFDHYRNMYLTYAYGKATDVNVEIKEFTDEKERLMKEKGKIIEKLLVNIYLKYSIFQRNSTRHIELNVSPEEYKKRNTLLLRMWSWIGSTTHMTLLIVFTVAYRIEWYLIITITLGNLLFLLIWLRQRMVLKELSRKG
ncbi:MAG: CDP-alcohol phosphatidyltransferase family protein [Ignavibacteria bacterium]|nr:CDP-alcohol phosphatidyltransferase family protein [Ignavibacteria bacterium]